MSHDRGSSSGSSSAFTDALKAKKKKKDDGWSISFGDIDKVLGLGNLVGGTVTGAINIGRVLAPGSKAGEPSVGRTLGDFGKAIGGGIIETAQLPGDIGEALGDLIVPDRFRMNPDRSRGRIDSFFGTPVRKPGERLREDGIAPFAVQTIGDVAIGGGAISGLSKARRLSQARRSESIAELAARARPGAGEAAARAVSRPIRTTYDRAVVPKLQSGSRAVRAQRVAEHLAEAGDPDVVIPPVSTGQRVAARLDQTRTGRATRGAARTQERLGHTDILDILQRHRRYGVPIIRHLEKKGLPRAQAERMFLDELEFRGEIGPAGVIPEQLLPAARGQRSVIPEKVRSPELDEMFDKALEQYRRLDTESTARLQESPYQGSRGLEDVGSNEPRIPKALAQRVDQLPKAQEKAAKLRDELDSLVSEQSALKADAKRLRSAPVRKEARDTGGARGVERLVRREKNATARAKVLGEKAKGVRQTLRSLEKRSERTLREFEKAVNDPSVGNVPRRWKPMVDAVHDLKRQAETDPKLAAVVDEVDLSFPALVRRAEEHGFNPAYFADMPHSQVEQLVYRTFRLGQRPAGRAVASKRRRESRMALRKMDDAKERNLAALVAAHAETVAELRNNNLVKWVEDNAAWKVPAGMKKPKGWVEWDPVAYGLRRADEGASMSPNVRMVIPETVDGTLRKLASNPDNVVAKLLRGVTHPWRLFVLTLSHTWYLNNAIGNIILGTAAGVRPQDWARAWRSSRRDSSGIRWSDVNIPAGVSDINLERASSLVGMEPMLGPGGAGTGALRRNLAAAMEQGGVREASRYFQSLMVRANEFVDELARAGVWHKTMRESGGKARTISDDLGRKRTGYEGGDATKATLDSFRQVVDYTDLTPFERAYVRSVIPFLSWQKGILKVMGNLAVDHPIRLRTMQLLNEVNRDLSAELFGGQLPSYYEEGLIPVGDGAINVRSFNPFSDAASLGTVEGIRSSLNPFVELVTRGTLDAPEFLSQANWQPDRFGFSRPGVSAWPGLPEVFTETPPFRYARGEKDVIPPVTYYDQERLKELLARGPAAGDSGGKSRAEALLNALS